MDDFDRLAKAAHDHHGALSRGESWPYSTEAERNANMELAVQQHIDAIARLMREGGSVAEFRSETMRLTGGSTYGWPVKLTMAFVDNDGQLSGTDCWDIVLHCSGRPPAPWPGTPRGRPKDGGSLEKARPTSPKKKERQRSPENEAQRKANYESVLASGRRFRASGHVCRVNRKDLGSGAGRLIFRQRKTAIKS